MEEAKEVHKCLRIAAGIFTHIRVSIFCSSVPVDGLDIENLSLLLSLDNVQDTSMYLRQVLLVPWFNAVHLSDVMMEGSDVMLEGSADQSAHSFYKRAGGVLIKNK